MFPYKYTVYNDIVCRFTNLFFEKKKKVQIVVQFCILSDKIITTKQQKNGNLHKNIFKNIKGGGKVHKRYLVRNITDVFSFCC